MKSSSGRSPLARFVLAVLAWLPVTFAVWYFAAPLILWPATLLTDLVARAGFGDLVTAVEQNAAVVTFATSLKAGQAIVGGVVAVEVNALLYSFGLPMFVALTLAAHQPHWLRALAIGYAVLVPAIAWGVLADFLKNIAITAAPQVASQAGFSPIQRELIVFAFQFGSLILPTVAPAIVWVLMHRGFLERIRRVAA
ncbi:MAG: exosortase H-associated membrane protein [Casimicrobiaceae bacterium]